MNPAPDLLGEGGEPARAREASPPGVAVPPRETCNGNYENKVEAIKIQENNYLTAGLDIPAMFIQRILANFTHPLP